MGRPPNQLSELTTNGKAGYDGLWNLGKKMNSMALSWKLLEDLRSERVGVWEVECQALTRSMNRIVKKGHERPALGKGWYGNGIQ